MTAPVRPISRVESVLRNHERLYTPEFRRAADWVLGQEGGVRNPGISEEALFDFHRHNGLKWTTGYASQLEEDPNNSLLPAFRDASPTNETPRRRAIMAVYHDFWQRSGAQGMEPALGLVHFDAAINHGLGNANQLYRRSGGDPYAYIDNRIKFYQQIGAHNPEGTARQNPGWVNKRMPALEDMVQQILIEEDQKKGSH